MIETLGLIVGTLVVIEAQPLHRVENRLHRLLRRPLQIGILDAQYETALCFTAVEPAEQGRTRATNVQYSGRTRGKSGFYH